MTKYQYYQNRGIVKLQERVRFVKPNLTLRDLEEVPECKNFIDWYRKASPREQFVYYRGSSLVGNLATWKIRTITWKYATNGWVYLVQRKLETDDYEFIAQKAQEKIRKMIPFDTNDAGWLISKDIKWPKQKQ